MCSMAFSPAPTAADCTQQEAANQILVFTIDETGQLTPDEPMDAQGFIRACDLGKRPISFGQQIWPTTGPRLRYEHPDRSLRHAYARPWMGHRVHQDNERSVRKLSQYIQRVRCGRGNR